MWEWLQTLSGGAATFVGSATGSAIGLIALLLGALFNAHLNRRRDDRIRKEDARKLATALRAELSGLLATLEANTKMLKEQPPEAGGGLLTPDLGQSVRIMPHLLDKIGLLDVATLRAVIESYLVIEQYAQKLVLVGGTLVENMPGDKRVVSLRAEQTELVITITEAVIDKIRESVKMLSTYVR
jgi:hypothetical protein